MTEIEELSNDVLRISYRRGWFGKICNLGAGIFALAFAVLILVWGAGDISTAKYPAFATPFLMLMELASLMAAFFLISRVFDVICYNFDKTTDKFCVRGQKYFFKRQVSEGAVSEIVGVSHEVFETDDHTSSEICLKFRLYGSVVETLKCGTGDVGEDNHIADMIERFLKWKRKIENL